MLRDLPFSRKLRLRSKFILFSIGIAIVPLLVVISVTTIHFTEVERRNALNLNEQIAQGAAEEIAAFINLVFNTLDNLDMLGPGLQTDPKQQEAILERILYSEYNFVDIAIVDAQGKEIARKNVIKLITSQDFQDRSKSVEYQKIKEDQYYLGPVYLSEGRPSFILGKQLIGADGSFRGAIFVQIDARILQQVITKITATNQESRVYIVNDQGRVIAHPDISQVLAQKDLSAIPPVKAFLQNSKINKLDIYKNELQERVIGAGALVPQVDWLVIAEQPAKLVLAPIYQIIFFTLSVLTIVLITASMIAYIFARHVVLPIELVHKAYERFGHGDLNFKLAIQTNDEIEDLAAGFNQMADKLKISIENLQKDRAVIAVERNKMAVVLSGISDAVIAIDLNQNIVLFNLAAQQLIGFSEEEALGKPINQILRLYDQDHELTPLNYCPIGNNQFQQSNINKRNLKLIGRNLKQTWVNLLSSKITDQTVANIGCIMTFYDVTKEKQLEEMKLDFVSMAAHELRTPLTSIRGYLSVLQTELSLQGEHKQFFDRTIIATSQLADLVENLLNVSRIERGTFAISMVPIDWPAYVRETVNEFISRAKDKNINLEFIEPPKDLPAIKADKLRIKEVLSNLLSNAINYTDPGGSVKVWIEPKEAEFITHIQDTGRGIPQEAIPQLFNKFFRISGSLEQGPKGTGLGLYIAKSIMTMHHGKILVESQLGKGSTFSFSLPT